MPANLKKDDRHIDDMNESVQPWQQPGTLSATHESFKYASKVSTTFPKAPFQAYEQPGEYPQERESIFHPVKAIDDILTAIDRMSQRLDLLVNQMLLERTFTDEPASLGSTVGYLVDYKERKYLYALTWSATTLQAAGGTIALTAGQWKNVSYPRGTVLTIQGGNDQAPVVVVFRHCDVIMN